MFIIHVCTQNSSLYILLPSKQINFSEIQTMELCMRIHRTGRVSRSAENTNTTDAASLLSRSIVTHHPILLRILPRKTDRIGTAREITKTDYEILVSSARNLAFTKCDSLLLLAKRFDPFDLFGAVNANICARSALFRFRHRCTCVGDLSASCRVFAIFLKILSRPLAREKSRYVSVISVLNRSISWMMLRIDEFYQVNCATTI